MEYIRRCTLVFLLALIAACSTIQAPTIRYQSGNEEGKPGPSINIELSSGKSSDVLSDSSQSTEHTKPSDETLASEIDAQFKCSTKIALDILKYATTYAYNDFPKREHILAIIAIESRFNPNAVSNGSRGVMQVLVKTHRKKIVGPFDLKEQIRVGVAILREAYEDVGRNPKAAVMAYNVGTGAYKRGSRPKEYYSKYLKNYTWIMSQERRLRLV